jgi:excisionase family DNA binding protein
MQQWYTPRQAAEVIGVHRNTLLSHIRQGTIKAVRLGPRTIRISAEELAKLQGAEAEDVK